MPNDDILTITDPKIAVVRLGDMMRDRQWGADLDAGRYDATKQFEHLSKLIAYAGNDAMREKMTLENNEEFSSRLKSGDFEAKRQIQVLDALINGRPVT